MISGGEESGFAWIIYLSVAPSLLSDFPSGRNAMPLEAPFQRLLLDEVEVVPASSLNWNSCFRAREMYRDYRTNEKLFSRKVTRNG